MAAAAAELRPHARTTPHRTGFRGGVWGRSTSSSLRSYIVAIIVTAAITESTLSMSRRCTLRALAFTRGRARTECTARTYIHTHNARHTHGRTHKCIMVVNNRGEKKTLATENALLFQTGFDLIQFKHFVDLI